MLPPITLFSNPKKILREKMKAERRSAAAARPDAARHAARNFIAALDIPPGAVVSLYHPMGDELSTEPLMEALAGKGARLALPVVARKKAPLAFRAYAPGDGLVDGVYGALTPGEDAEALTPSILVVPLLAFTRAGGRLGYGGGYYDRTLEALRREGDILAFGYAYGAQEVDALPLSPLDQPLDWIVTERGTIRC